MATDDCSSPGSQFNSWAWVALSVTSQNPGTAVFLSCYPHALSLGGWTRSWCLVAFLLWGLHASIFTMISSIFWSSPDCMLQKRLDSLGGNCALIPRSTLICHDGAVLQEALLGLLGGWWFLPLPDELDGTRCSHRPNTANKFYWLKRDQ